MISIRRRTTTLVALSTSGSILVGGIALFVALRGVVTAQFDDALAAHTAALQALTHFDGTKVEMDFSGDAMPRFASRTNAEFFVAWVRDGGNLRVLERSESLRDDQWPSPAVIDGVGGIRDLALPGGGSGRAMLVEFAAEDERDEESEQRGDTQMSKASAPVVRLLVAMPRDPLDSTLALIEGCILGVGGALALASIAASRWAVTRGLVPLSDLSKRVQALGPGTLGTRFDAAGMPTELRPIAEQLSALLARLEEAFERERRFSTAASHELRTPIAELRMLLEVAANRPRSGDEWLHTADVGLGVLARAQSLCETLLSLSRAEAEGESGRGDTRTDVGGVIREQSVRAIKAHGGDPRRVRIECLQGLMACIDEASLSSIVGNLVDNALSHGQATTEAPVMVVARANSERVQIEVANLAASITATDLNHLFEPFWRKDESRNDRRGFGLGLAVARTLARAAGGDITASLEGVGTLKVQVSLLAPQ